MNDPLQRPWSFGSSYVPPSYIFLPDLGGWDVTIMPPQNGVILYEAVSRLGLMAGVGVAVFRAVAAGMGLASRVAATSFATIEMQIGAQVATPGATF